jgi:hypothetical protein
VKPGDLVRSKTLQRLAGAVRSKMESYKKFKGIATVIEVTSRSGVQHCNVMLDTGGSMWVKSSSLESIK